MKKVKKKEPVNKKGKGMPYEKNSIKNELLSDKQLESMALDGVNGDEVSFENLEELMKSYVETDDEEIKEKLKKTLEASKSKPESLSDSKVLNNLDGLQLMDLYRDIDNDFLKKEIVEVLKQIPPEESFVDPERKKYFEERRSQIEELSSPKSIGESLKPYTEETDEEIKEKLQTTSEEVFERDFDKRRRSAAEKQFFQRKKEGKPPYGISDKMVDRFLKKKDKKSIKDLSKEEFSDLSAIGLHSNSLNVRRESDLDRPYHLRNYLASIKAVNTLNERIGEEIVPLNKKEKELLEIGDIKKIIKDTK